MDAEFMDTEDETISKAGAELITAVGRALDDAGRERGGTIVGGTHIE